MKRVRWDGTYFRVSNGEPEGRLVFSEEYIDCEKHADWREIESGTLDVDSGKFRLVLKPVPEKPRTAMVEVELPPVTGVNGVRFYAFYSDGSYATAMYGMNSRVHNAFASESENKTFSRVDLSAPAKPSENDGRIPQQLLDAIDPSAVNGGTRAVLLVSDGGWAVKDFPFGVDTGKVELWCGPSVLESNWSHDRVKPKEAAQ